MSFKVISINLNGIRSAKSKGFFDWLVTQDADVVCLQEVRADYVVLSDSQFSLPNYNCEFVCAEKKGYSGVGIFAKKTPDKVIKKFNHPCFDDEGRFIAFEFENLIICSIYLHSGTTGSVRQDYKFKAMALLAQKMKNWQNGEKSIILSGDFNIIHTEKDIKNFKQNQKTSGCLPEERAWLDKLFFKQKWIDSFREIKQAENQYTWWSNRGQARNNNVGWRIDYQLLSHHLKNTVKKTDIFTTTKFSDHAPYIVEYQF